MAMRILLILIICQLLAGCEITPVKSENGLVKLLEVQKRADEAYWKEDWDVAEQDYLYLAKSLPEDVEPRFRLGNIYARTDRLDAAASAYREALAIDSSNSKIWHNLGIVHLRQASNTFMEMLEHTDPSDPLNLRARAMLDIITRAMASRFGINATE